MMTPNETELFAQLERLAASCPWESVDIWISRQPGGEISFTTHLGGNADLGLEYKFEHGATPAAAVDAMLKAVGDRDPEKAKKAKIAELRMQIAKLEQKSFTLPPYRPTPMIGAPPAAPAPMPPPRGGDVLINIASSRSDA